MAYSKQTWADGPGGGTPISAARLQHMEDGIAAALAAVKTYPTRVAAEAGLAAGEFADGALILITGQ